MTDQYWYRLNNLSVRPTGRPDLSEILPRLLVGEYPTPRDAAWLQSVHGVTAVVSLQDDADLASKGLDLNHLLEVYARQGLRFERVAIGDCDTVALESRLDLLVHLLDALLRGGECVYLHCNAGMNRAPTVAIAYLHACTGLSLEEARDLVKRRRACVPYMTVLHGHFGQPRSPQAEATAQDPPAPSTATEPGGRKRDMEDEG